MKKISFHATTWLSIPRDTHLSILVFALLTAVSNLTLRAGLTGLFPQVLAGAVLVSLVVMVVLSLRDLRTGDAFRSSKDPERF